MQVLLDSDVAMLYGYETGHINRAASRNKERFPEDFRFQLTKEETEILKCQNGISRCQNGTLNGEPSLSDSMRSQIATLNEVESSRSQNVTLKRGKNKKYLPYAYTEQGIAMLSGLLKNDIAVQVSIGIMQAFVEMRHALTAYGSTFERLTTVEYKLLDHDKRFDELFDLIQSPAEFRQGIFHKGQIYDAFKLITDIIRSAEQSIVIIDNYADASVLEMLTDKKDGVAVTIVTGKPNLISTLALNKFIAQYPETRVLKSDNFHDRFIVIDENKLYHIGASLKDAGKKCFAVSILDNQSVIKAILSELTE